VIKALQLFQMLLQQTSRLWVMLLLAGLQMLLPCPLQPPAPVMVAAARWLLQVICWLKPGWWFWAAGIWMWTHQLEALP
jgi:hypothetical protein